MLAVEAKKKIILSVDFFFVKPDNCLSLTLVEELLSSLTSRAIDEKIDAL